LPIADLPAVYVLKINPAPAVRRVAVISTAGAGIITAVVKRVCPAAGDVINFHVRRYA